MLPEDRIIVFAVSITSIISVMSVSLASLKNATRYDDQHNTLRWASQHVMLTIATRYVFPHGKD